MQTNKEEYGLCHSRAGLDEHAACCGMQQMKRKRTRRAIAMTATVRRQTAPEQRRFEAALELLLTEIVRQEITSRKAVNHEREEPSR